MGTIREQGRVGGGTATCVDCGTPEPESACASCGCPQRPGGYTAVRVISRHPWGRVFRVHDAEGRPLMLRELIFSRAATAQQLDAFEKEASILGSLKHPAVPQLVRSFREGSAEHQRLYLAYAHRDATSLLDQLPAHRFDEREARRITRRLLELLDYLHGLSPPVLHRDLKAANVLWGDETLTVMGFGAARELRPDSQVELPPDGCVGHVAPEQRLGRASFASDLYGVGVTLLEVLARRPPEEILVADGRPVLEPHINVSAEFRRLLERLLATDPGQRPASAREALNQLDRIEGRQGASSTGLRERVATGLARVLASRRRWVGALTALALTFGAGYGVGQSNAPLRKVYVGTQGWQVPAELLSRASVNGKYTQLLRVMEAPNDLSRYGDFRDYGYDSTSSYAGQSGLPPGFWVYVAPNWYLWGERVSGGGSGTHATGRWGTNQALGAPDTAGAGDIPTAWASKTADGQREWLSVGFGESVETTAVHIVETFNPGAVVRVVGLTPGGERVELWSAAPGRVDASRRELVIPLSTPMKLEEVFIELDSPAVPGWNEIDAIGLETRSGALHWATSAKASSSYAE